MMNFVSSLPSEWRFLIEHLSKLKVAMCTNSCLTDGSLFLLMVSINLLWLTITVL